MKIHPSAHFVGRIAIALLATSSLNAQNSTWGGGGTTNNWSDAANWDIAPSNGNNLIFTLATRPTNINDSLTSVGNVSVQTTTVNWSISGNDLTLNGNLGIATTTANRFLVWGINTTLAAGTRALTARPSNTLQINGLLTGSGGISRAAVITTDTFGGGLLLNNSANSFTGNVTLNVGNTRVTSLANSGQNSSLGAGTTAITLGNSVSVNRAELTYEGAGNTGTNRGLDLRGRSSSSATLATIRNNSSNNGNLTFSGTNTYFNNTANATTALIFDGTSTGSTVMDSVLLNSGTFILAVTKQGNGSLVLNNTNTYTGATTVSAGTLLINGSTSVGSAVSVASGAALGGNGTINGVANITGSLRPGNSIGTLNAGTTTWLGAASAGIATDWVFELGASNTSDLLNITGDFTRNTSLGSMFRFNFAGSTALGTFKLVDWSGATTFSAADFTSTNLGGGNTGSFQFDGTSLQFVSVPEPSSALLLGLGAVALILLRRHRAVAQKS